MQISRHWRMNSQRYRLEGVRYENGRVSLQARPAINNCTDAGENRSVYDENTNLKRMRRQRVMAVA